MLIVRTTSINILSFVIFAVVIIFTVFDQLFPNIDETLLSRLQKQPYALRKWAKSSETCSGPLTFTFSYYIMWS